MTFPIPDAALSQHIIVLGKTRSGKSSTMRLMVEKLLDDGKPVCILDPKGDWWGLKSSASGKRAGFPVVIFGGEHADVPINATAGAYVAELVATGNRPCIIDLGGWSVGDRTRFFIDFASTLFRHTRGPRWLVIDECHNFAPQGKIMDPQAGQMLHWANRLASEGAGKGVTLISASQRPQKVTKDYVTSHETLIAMRVIHPLDRRAIEDWINGCPDAEKGKEVLRTLASMKRGQGWVWSPEIGFGPVCVQFPLFKTYDSFAAPSGEAVAKLSGWAAVDLDEVKEKLAAVLEEAKANDPKLLKAEVARLRKELAAKTAAPAETDPKAIAAAEQAGYDRGEAELAPIWFRRGVEAAVREFQDFAKGFGSTAFILKELETWKGLGALPPASRPTAQRTPVTLQIAQAVARVQRAPKHNGYAGDAKLAKAERLALTALAQYPHGRSKNQVAILTGYAVNGGGFNNALSALRTNGFITGSGDSLEITDAGLEALGPYDPLPTGQALLDHWMRQLGKAEREALRVLVEAWPKALSKEHTAACAGYAPDGGGFNNALSRLRTLELVSGRGEIKASDDLFGGGHA